MTAYVPDRIAGYDDEDDDKPFMPTDEVFWTVICLFEFVSKSF